MNVEEIITNIKTAHGLKNQVALAKFLSTSDKNIVGRRKSGGLLNLIAKGLEKRGLDLADYLTDPPPPEADTMEKLHTRIDDLIQLITGQNNALQQDIGAIKADLDYCKKEIQKFGAPSPKKTAAK